MNTEHNNETVHNEPVRQVSIGNTEITLLGTAHVSRASADKVRELLQTGEYDSVAIELCPSRYNAVIDPDALSRMDLFQVIREKKATMVAASLALGAFQQRMAEQFGIKPGDEMRAAIDHAHQSELPIALIDREIGTTLKRTYRNVSWWKRMGVIGSLLGSITSREKISEQDIENLKQRDILETVFQEFSDHSADLHKPLIDERDQYMAACIRREIATERPSRMLVVVGAGHLKGIEHYLQHEQRQPEQVLPELDELPPPRKWVRALPWLIVALIVTGFAIGFSKDTSLGWELVRDWILINGGLSAAGALLAGAHPLTIATAFLAAPLTSLNPMIGAGFVAVAMEMYLRRPQVRDFEQLRHDTTHLKGWWKNRVTRTLLVFFLSSLGSAIGTWVAGISIYERIT